MTTSYFRYSQLAGESWPPFLSAEKEWIKVSSFIKNELANFNYQHSPSFLDMYAIEKKCNYINIAQGAASNFMIRLQIEQAIKLKPDYVIVGATSSDRIDIPIKNFKHDLLIRNFDTRTEEELGITNDIISKLDPNFFSTTSNSGAVFNTLSDNIKTAMKYYATYLFNNNLNLTKDFYLIQSGLSKLKENNISYVFIPGPLRDKDWSDQHIVWPSDTCQPWDMHLGTDDKTHNHNPYIAHLEYLEILKEITNHWN